MIYSLDFKKVIQACNVLLLLMKSFSITEINTNQTISAHVKWGSQHSCNVSISNGVKQGGMLSPVLFTIYIDVLFTMLKDSGLGCHIGTNFMGAVGYADDIALIAPSVMSLKKMLHICDRFDGSVLMMSHLMSPSISLFVIATIYRDEFNGINHNDFCIKKPDFACQLGNVIGPNPNKLYDLVINKFITNFNGINV